VPAGLLQPAPKVHKLVERRTQFSVYFVAAGRLIGEPRPGRPTPALALQYLESGPDRGEVLAGITTSVPNNEGASIIRIHKDTAIVNLNGGFGELSPLGVAQLVWTLTVPPVKSVMFLEANQPVNVPTGSGPCCRYIAGAVTRADYENYAPA
jgi:hypothetical protein